MSTLVGLCQPIILIGCMGLDLFWNPITDTISLIKKKEKKNKYKEKYAYINQQRGFPRELIVAFQYLKGAYKQEG